MEYDPLRKAQDCEALPINMSIKGNIDDVVGKETTLVAGGTLNNYCSGRGTKMDDADKPCTETSPVAQSAAKKIEQCNSDLIEETTTAEIDTRESIHKKTGCGDHAGLTDVCNNTDEVEKEWNKVKLSEPLSMDAETETKGKSYAQSNAENDEIEETSTVNSSTSEIDLTKEDDGAAEIAEVENSSNAEETSTVNASTSEIYLTKEHDGAAEIAEIENSSTAKNALITDEGKAVKLAPANKELMSVMAASKMSCCGAEGSDEKAVPSIFEKLFTVTDRLDSNKKILNTSEDVVKMKNDEKGKCLDRQTPVPPALTSDALSKNSSCKFTCIGPAQLVTRTVVSNAKLGTSTVPLSSGSKRTKHTEKFIIKNAGKAAKMYKMSKMSYKINPVRKNLESNPTYPVIYVGEPAFMKDFLEAGHKGSINIVSPPTEIKEEDLYDISKLQNAFTPIENASALNTKPGIGKPYPCSPHPYSPLCPELNQLFIPPTPFRYPGISNLNPGGVIRIVARTVPSATIASHTTTSTSGINQFSLSTQKRVRVYQAIHPIPLPPSQLQTTANPVILKARAPRVSVAQQITNAVKRGVMTVKLLPGTNTATTKTETAKIQHPVKFLPSSVLPKVANCLTVTAGKDKTPAPLVIIPSKKDVQARLVVQSSSTSKCSVAQQSKETKFSNYLAKIASTHTENKIAMAKPKPVAKIVGNPMAECRPSAEKQLSTVTSPTTASSKPLREGVEVIFEDGVRYFITSLKQMTHQDDEPIKSWSDLRKGTNVAAKWVDGYMYDATIAACYFSVDRPTTRWIDHQPISVDLSSVVQPEKPSEKSQKSSPKVQTQKENDSSIGCTECRSVFKSLGRFRKHQKMKCQRPGIIVPKSAMVVTDVMIEAVGKEERGASRKKFERPSNETKKSNTHSRKREMVESEIEKNPPLKKRKTKPVEEPIVLNKADDDDDAIFKTGTKFLHRWQLDDGTSKWYQGEVIRTVSKGKAFLDCEFEVSYKGERENYVLKLYEDYPADIRIIGKK